MLRANFTSALFLAKKVIGLLHGLRESNQTSKMLLEFLERRFRQIELQASEVRRLQAPGERIELMDYLFIDIWLYGILFYTSITT